MSARERASAVSGPSGPFVIACGALARELRAVLPGEAEVTYLPARFHNEPDRIVPAVRAILEELDPDRPVVVAYGDCGTGGHLDRLLVDHPNAHRLAGPHCYSFFAGDATFSAIADAELGTFYLTDYLARHFDALVWRAYRLDEHPELIGTLFAHYTRVVHLAQTDDPVVAGAADAAARRLGLPIERVDTGLEPLDREIAVALSSSGAGRTVEVG